jgi:ferredoxin/flavodoxin---NADP+ reductase
MTASGKTPRRQIELRPHKILSVTEISKDVFTMDLERTFDFLPGQVVAIGLSPNDTEPRLYSIASGIGQPFIRILFDINPTGKLTPLMAAMKPGQTLFVSNPIGKFIGNNDEAWWIATGTGIAPFISMAESGLMQNKTLLHGARTLDKFFYGSYFEDVLGKNYMRFCTTQQAPHVIYGRLTAYLQSLPSLNPSIKYYLCGSSQMVIDVREILAEQKQVPFDNIIAEIYF